MNMHVHDASILISEFPTEPLVGYSTAAQALTAGKIVNESRQEGRRIDEMLGNKITAFVWDDTKAVLDIGSGRSLVFHCGDSAAEWTVTEIGRHPPVLPTPNHYRILEIQLDEEHFIWDRVYISQQCVGRTICGFWATQLTARIVLEKSLCLEFFVLVRSDVHTPYLCWLTDSERALDRSRLRLFE